MICRVDRFPAGRQCKLVSLLPAAVEFAVREEKDGKE